MFAIVGAGGYWGPNWTRVLKQLNVLGAICDKDEDKLAALGERFDLASAGIKMVTDYNELLDEDFVGVFVVTPPNTHATLAIEAMKMGKHVFIEKPMAGSLEDCYRIKFESERLNKIVMVGHTFVYHPAVRKFKELLPRLGRVRSIYTIRTNFGLYQEVGLLHDLLPHDLSIFTYLCNGSPISFRSNVNPHNDVAYVNMNYGEIECSAFLSWSYPEKTRRLVAVGEKGILEWDLSWSDILLHRKWAHPLEGQRSYKHHDEGTQTFAVEDRSEPLMNEALHFMECIRQEKSPFTGIEDGINVVKGLESCR